MFRRSAGVIALAAAAAAGWVEARESPRPSRPHGTPTAHPEAQADSSIVVLIGLDAFRWDFLDRPGARHLRALAARGARTERLVPSFPTKTYPNFYTLVTGLLPDHHGIVANNMVDPELGRFAIGNDPSVRDGRWFGGEPIWVTAERQGVRTAVHFWPGNEAEIGGVRPTWHVGYHKSVSRADRVFRVLDWLALPPARRPRLVTTYFEDVDDAAHATGPTSQHTDRAIAAVDSAIGAIVDGIAALGLGGVATVVVVSDHGMTATSPDGWIYLDDYVSLDSLEVIDWTPVGAVMPRAGREEYVYARLKRAHPHLGVYRRDEIPERFRFGRHPRVAPIVLIADEGWTITTRAQASRAGDSWSRGQHGFDHELLSMGGILVGAGPGLATGVTVPPLQNVHVYSLLAALLGVTPARTDGSLDSVGALLKARRP